MTKAILPDEAARAPGEFSRIAESLSVLSRSFSQARAHEQLLQEAGIRLDRAGLALLFKLHRHASGPLRVGDLAELLGIDTPAVTRKVQQLERLGYVASTPDVEDKRAKRISLTRSGQKIVDRFLIAFNNRLARLFAGWSDEELSAFDSALERFATSLTEEMETLRD